MGNINYELFYTLIIGFSKLLISLLNLDKAFSPILVLLLLLLLLLIRSFTVTVYSLRAVCGTYINPVILCCKIFSWQKML